MCMGPTSRHSGPVDGGAELGGPFLHGHPVRSEDVESPGRGGPDGQQRQTETTGRPGPRRRHLGGHGHLEARVGIGPELEAGVAQGEPVRLPGHELGAVEKGQDRLQGLLHAVALHGRVDAHHEGVRRQRSGPDAEHHPAPGQMVEQDHAVGQDERLVVGERAHARSEADVLGAL